LGTLDVIVRTTVRKEHKTRRHEQQERRLFASQYPHVNLTYCDTEHKRYNKPNYLSLKKATLLHEGVHSDHPSDRNKTHWYEQRRI
jgi:hypothetical protein